VAATPGGHSYKYPSRANARRKIHNVWQLSFDWKECRSDRFIEQKLDYMHSNPCSGKWKLCLQETDYIHSSARFYEINASYSYKVDHIDKMKDIALLKTN
jgi:hypothetical protein